MKTKITILTIMLIITSKIFLFGQSAQEIIERADSMFELKQVYSRSTLSITRNGRAQAAQVMEGYELEDEDGTARFLTVFSAPPRVAGTAYLTVGDDLWVRFASTGRVRKMSSSAKSNSAAGSDFSYSDMGEGSNSFSDDYRSNLLGEDNFNGESSWRIELIPNPGTETDYEKLNVWITKEDFRYVKIEYFQDNSPIKIMELSDYRPVSGVDYPFRIEMQSLTQDSVSVITTEEIEENSSRVQDRFFSTSYLRTIR